MLTNIVFICAGAYTIFLVYKAIRTIALQKEIKPAANNNVLTRILIGGFVGFILFFSAFWIYLNVSGKIKYLWNPYAGPPPLLACLASGYFGFVSGAIVGLFKKRS